MRWLSDKYFPAVRWISEITVQARGKYRGQVLAGIPSVSS